jgi:hypothetical protein
MRSGPDSKLFLVTDPTSESETADVVYETTLRGLELQFKGGLTMAQNPTLFTDEKEAKIEAFGRVTAMRAKRAIERQVASGDLRGIPERLEILDGDGKLLFEADLT